MEFLISRASNKKPPCDEADLCRDTVFGKEYKINISTMEEWLELMRKYGNLAMVKNELGELEIVIIDGHWE